MDKGMLADATSSDDSPTPGYMLVDIARQTLSNYTACTQLIEYLTNRLTKKNHNIKYKCLVIIKSVCRTGRTEFKRDMARNTDAIKECLQFKGPPDPLRGDEIYRRVREMAKETLDAIFDSQQPVSSTAVSAKIQAFSGGEPTPPPSVSSPWAPPSAGPYNPSFSSSSTGARAAGQEPLSAQGHGMQGFGNPNFQEPKQEKTWMQSAASLVASAKAALKYDSGKFDTGPEPGRQYNPDPSYGYTTNRGANSYGGNDPGYRPQDPSAILSSVRGGMVPDLPANNAGAAESDGSYERQLIEDLCEPGGTRAVPPDDKLQTFITCASTLSADIVGPCLSEALASDSWQSVVKALIVIAALGKTRGCEELADWIAENDGETIKRYTSDVKLSIRQQAMKTARALRLATSSGKEKDDDSSNASTAATSTALGKASKPQPAIVNLIDTDDDPIPISAASAAPVSSLGLFDGMAVSASESPQPATSGFSFMSGTSTVLPTDLPPPTPTPSVAPVADDPFDFLGSSQPTVLVTTPAPAPAPAPATSNSSSVDIFGSMNLGGSSTSISQGLGAPQSVLGNLSSLDLNNSTRGPVSPGFPVGMDLANQNMYLQQQLQMQQIQLQQMQMQQMNKGPMGSYPNNFYPPNPTTPFIGTSMGSISTIRTVIPSALDPQASSGFSFMSNINEPSKKAADSFSFVNDAMKASKK